MVSYTLFDFLKLVSIFEKFITMIFLIYNKFDLLYFLHSKTYKDQ